MKKIKILSFVTVLALVFAFIFNLTPTTALASQSDFDCEYSAATANQITTNLPYFGCNSVVTYTEEEAIAANIPTGFTGSVLEVNRPSDTSKGLVLDFTSKKIPVDIVTSISVRLFVYDDGVKGDIYPEVRIPRIGQTGSWTLRHSIANSTGQWTEVEIVEGSTKDYDCNFDHLAINGYLGKVELAVRNNTTQNPFYID